jgi:hypothetical protein
MTSTLMRLRVGQHAALRAIALDSFAASFRLPSVVKTP